MTLDSPNLSIGLSFIACGNISRVQNSSEDPNETNQLASVSHQFAYALKILQPCLCVFGIFGNILTLYILGGKKLKVLCDGTERTVHIGLAALSASDLLFCVSLLPYGITQGTSLYKVKTFELYYRTYGTALISCFIMTSTWLTVTMAFSRYLAICNPFKARHFIGLKGVKVTVAVVYATCISFNIPRFLLHDIYVLECDNGQRWYFRYNGYLMNEPALYEVYIWSYFTIGILIPLLSLCFCNIRLVRALNESIRIRRQYRVPVAHLDSNHRISSILVAIVILYLVLVSPAEVFLFIQDRLHVVLHLPVQLTNLLQCINFSCSFLFYFALNSYFRRELRSIWVRWVSVCSRGKSQREHSYRTSQTRL